MAPLRRFCVLSLHMPIQILGYFILFIGVALAFGAYRAVTSHEIETITAVLIPAAHLAAGIGLTYRQDSSRYLAFVLSCFYALLGILSFQGILEASDFIPIVPLIEFIPEVLLRWNLSVMLVLSFFVLPTLVALFLSLKPVAANFDETLEGLFSWNAPLLVVEVSAFLIIYSLLASSRLDFFASPEERIIFGYSLTEWPGRVVNGFVFLFPMALAVGLRRGERWAWVASLLYGGVWWFPFFRDGMPASRLRDFEFLFYGAGWAIVVLVLLIYWQYFWQYDAWREKRVAKVHRLGKFISEPTEVGAIDAASRAHQQAAQSRQESPLHPGEEPVAAHRPEVSKKIVFFVLLLMVVSGVIILVVSWSAAPFFVSWLDDAKQEWPKPGEHAEVMPAGVDAAEEVGATQELSLHQIRVEGTSVDPQGSYAIVNGEVVQIGERVQGYRVEAIERNRVLLSKDGESKWYAVHST